MPVRLREPGWLDEYYANRDPNEEGQMELEIEDVPWDDDIPFGNIQTDEDVLKDRPELSGERQKEELDRSHYYRGFKTP